MVHPSALKDSNHDESEAKMLKHLSDSICGLTLVLKAGVEQRKQEFDWLKSHAGLATKQDLKEMEKRIMSKISDFAAAQNAFNDRQDAAITALQGDIKALNDKIEELQNSPGEVTPEDQALLDQLQVRAGTIADKLDALDALTPPVVPAPPVP